ncbi:hypothetical protein BCR44DRAFT_72301 [Catenaria anguillulae PL171]|uniref:Mucoidy inhibitor A n=1 Tax=Catenaria anguillulae PL171 TaxID=765915 RepID=A0A1Y2H4Z8_9FUNG|nr:hypothetical protein BCR44DRAFT_72301 [Catenaria anguillulae PL171]
MTAMTCCLHMQKKSVDILTALVLDPTTMARLPIVLSCRDHPVTHVTLYRDSAEVSRHLTGIAIEGNGPTVIQLKGVPQAVDLNSVRVELVQQPQKKQQFIIGDVSLATLPSDPLPPSPPSARDLQVAEKRSRLALLRQQQTELRARLEVVLYLVSLTQDYASTQSTLKSNSLDPVAGFLEGFMPGHEAALRDLAMKKVQLDAEIKERAEEAQELFAWFARTGNSVSDDAGDTHTGPFREVAVDKSIKAIVVSVEAVADVEGEEAVEVSDAPKEIELNVSYMIDNASWTPNYDLSISTKPESVMSAAQLQYRAIVKQNTGEDWLNARLTLSTAAGGTSWWQLQRSPPKFTRRWELSIKQPVPAVDPTKLGSGSSTGFAAYATQSTVKFGVPSALASSQPVSVFGGGSGSIAFGSSATPATGSGFGFGGFGAAATTAAGPGSGFGGFGSAQPNAAVMAATSQTPLAANAAVATTPAFVAPAPPADAPSATVTSDNTNNEDSTASSQASHATHFVATFLLPFPVTIRSDPNKSHRLIITSIRAMPVTFSHIVAANSFTAKGTESPKYLESSYFECSAPVLLHAELVNTSAFTLVPPPSPMRIHLNGLPLTASPGDTSFGHFKAAVMPSAKFSLNLGPDRSVCVVRKPRLSREVLPVASAGAFSRMLGGGAGNEVQDEVANRLGVDEKGTIRSVRYVIMNKKQSSGKASLVRVKFDEVIPVAKKAQNRVEVISPSGDQLRVFERETAASTDEERDSGSGEIARVYAKDGLVKFDVAVKSGETREIVYEYLVVRGKE